MRAPYMFNGQLWYANRKPGESPIGAVARSLERRLKAPITLWPNADETGEVWRAQWFDTESQTFKESLVKV